MADSKITALTALTAADPVNDMFPVVDVSDTTMAASGTTKKISVNNILGASGTATLASATITGAATVGTTLGVTGVSTLASAVVTGALAVDTTTLVANAAGYADRVGIGTATPAYPLQVVGNAVFDADATCKRFFVNNTTASANAYINSIDGSTSNIFLGGQTNYTDGAIIYDDASKFLLFRTNGVEAARFNSTGNLVLKGGTVGATGVGVTFPATQVASSDANTLDDYEEGTWTPTITSESGTIGTTTVTSANYTKIGRLVNVNFDVKVDSIGTGTGGLKVSLPFSASGEQNSGVGREIINTGNMCQVTRSTATTVYVYFYNNLTVIALNNRVVCNYTYNV